ncbi:MAG: lipoprotein [Oligoflexia bacterium]|nr:lipoprotein [Oligoflexia bacterium]
MKLIQKLFLICVCVAALVGCGVKGDPVPPATPAEIGRGKPLFKGEEVDSSIVPKRKAPAIEQKDEQENDNE